MADNPVLGIVITTYNRAAMLGEAIESVIAQDDLPKKIVVVDDGSTDDTAGLCRKYVERGVLQYISKRNGGCSSARNTGLHEVAGAVRYVSFLDSDDRQLPEFFQRAVRLLEADPQAGFCYADSIVFDEDTGRERLQRAAAAGDPDRFAVEHFLTNEAKVSSVLYRAETLRTRRFREDLRHNEDSEFLQRIAIDHRGVYCPEPASWIRWHSGSKSRNTLAINRAVLRSARDVLQDYPEFHGRYRQVVDKRVRQMEHSLFRSLALAGQWTEAESVATSMLERVSVAGRIALYYQLRALAGGMIRRIVRRHR